MAGIGTALLQEGKPVAYAYRSLTPCEQNYVPLELECLAIVFAADHFDQFIFGHRDVTIHTDHEPLEAIFKKSIHKIAQRLQAMLLHLQRYPNIKVSGRRAQNSTLRIYFPVTPTSTCIYTNSRRSTCFYAAKTRRTCCCRAA